MLTCALLMTSLHAKVRVMEMPSDRRKAKASVLGMKSGQTDAQGFSMPAVSLMTNAERAVIMDRVKSGEISMDEAMVYILDAEKEHAEQAEERLVMVCWKNEKHHLITTEVFMVGKLYVPVSRHCSALNQGRRVCVRARERARARARARQRARARSIEIEWERV